MKTIIFLIIAAVIAVGAVGYGLFGSSSKNAETSNTSEEQVEEQKTIDTETQSLSGVGSLEALKLLGANLECVINYDAPELTVPVIGTYFISGDKVRGDFEMTVPEFEESFVSSIIFNDGMMYSWSDIGGQKYGMKANLLALDENQETEAVREPVPSNVDVNYDCKVWTLVDGSVFEPPSDILFQDFSNIVETGMEYGTIYNEEN